uniref:Uncharacterized protein n=1 Tax=Parascaris equorum TaxID=6256 RepID=A0A914S4W7_PAREQ
APVLFIAILFRSFIEFQVYKASHQYKGIAEKYNLSKEHPGLGISPTLTEFMYTPKLGRNALFPNSWYHLGPRFFDKPLNEGTFEKGLACAKYAAILLGPYTMLEIRAMNSVTVKDFTPRTFMKRYFQLAPVPCKDFFIFQFMNEEFTSNYACFS